MAEERLLEITCPLCNEKLRAKEPRTLKQWKASLMVHLIASPRHYLKAEEAEAAITQYFNRLSYFLKVQEEKARSNLRPASRSQGPQNS